MTLFEKFLTYFGQNNLWEHWWGNNGNWNTEIYNPEHFHWLVLLINLVTISWIIYVARIILIEEYTNYYNDDIDKIFITFATVIGGGIIGALLIFFIPVIIIIYIFILFIQVILILMDPPKYKDKFRQIFPKKKKKIKVLTTTEVYKKSLLNN